MVRTLCIWLKEFADNLGVFMRSFGLISLACSLLCACGSSDTNKDTSSDDPVAWSEVTPILANTCGGSGSSCHNSTTANGEHNFTAIAKDELPTDRVLARIQSEDSPMPPEDTEQNPEGITLSESDKLTLVRYLSADDD